MVGGGTARAEGRGEGRGEGVRGRDAVVSSILPRPTPGALKILRENGEAANSNNNNDFLFQSRSGAGLGGVLQRGRGGGGVGVGGLIRHNKFNRKNEKRLGGLGPSGKV